MFIHSPGGDVAATESIINYIREKFNTDVRVFVPQLSMSGGTMIALLGKEIWMGSHSNLGPIDPQLGPFPAQLVLSEFDKAHLEIQQDPSRIHVWHPILSKLSPTFISQCELAIELSKTIGKETLMTSMFLNDEYKDEKAEHVVEFLTDMSANKIHNRHLHRDQCKQAGLVIKDFEDDQVLQNAIMSVHHANIISLMNMPVAKLIESGTGRSFIKTQ